MVERLRALGALVITAPTDQERLFTMAVRVPRAELEPRTPRPLYPWLTIRANVETQEITCAAGIRVTPL
jgi:hypothetical protein